MRNQRIKKTIKRSALKLRTVVGLILGMVSFNAILSYFVLVNQSLRLDESQSLWQASHSLGGMLRVVGMDVHVPLYHIILHFWVSGFGTSVLAIRSLSVLFLLLAIPMVYLVAKQLLSQRQALFAAALFSFSPFINWYGSEARMYTLLVLMTLISQYFFLRILKNQPGKNWLGYTLSAVIGVYSHYFFAFTLITQAIFYLVSHKSFVAGTFKRLVGVAIVVAVALSPWLMYVKSLGSASGTRPMLARPSSTDFFNTFSQFIFGFQPDQINTVIVSFWPAVILLAFLAVGKNKRFPREIMYIIMAALVPVIGAFIVSLTITPVFVSRYMIIVLPALFIFLAWVITNYSRTLAVATTIVLCVGIGLTSVHQNVSANTPVKENYREVAQELSSKVTASDAVVLSSPFTKYPFEYYYTGVAHIDTLPQWERGAMPNVDPAAFPAQIEAIAADHQYAYLVLSYNQGYEDTIKQYFDSHYQLVSTRDYSLGLTLLVYRLRYDLPIVN